MIIVRFWSILHVAGLLIGAVLFFSGCKSKQKAVDLSRSDTEISVTSVDNNSTFGASLSLEETTELVQFDESTGSLIEITGPAVIHPDGTIETTSDQSKVRKLAKTDKSKSIKTNTVKTDTAYQHTTEQTAVDSTRTESRKDKTVTVDKEPKTLAMIGLFGMVLIILWALWRYVIKPRIM